MNETKMLFAVKFLGITDCSMPHPSRKGFKVIIFADRLRIHKNS